MAISRSGQRHETHLLCGTPGSVMGGIHFGFRLIELLACNPSLLEKGFHALELLISVSRPRLQFRDSCPDIAVVEPGKNAARLHGLPLVGCQLHDAARHLRRNADRDAGLHRSCGVHRLHSKTSRRKRDSERFPANCTPKRPP